MKTSLHSAGPGQSGASRAKAGGLAAALLAAALAAQANDVERRNPGYLWLEASNHPNGNTRPDIRQNPPAHASGQVAAGTLSWVWIPASANDADVDESIAGFRAPLAPSAATGSGYPVTLYYPEVKIHPGKAIGSRVEPDLTLPAYFTHPEQPLVFGAYGYFESGVNLSTPYLLPRQEKDLVLSLKWKGGDGTYNPNTLAMWGDAHGQSYKLPVFGFATPQGAITAVTMGAYYPGYLNLTYKRTEPSVQVQTDWARSVFPPGSAIVGYSISSYELPAATRSVKIGFDLQAGGAYGNMTAVPMLNVGPMLQGSFVLLGQTIEVSPLDPAVGLLASLGYVLRLDSAGFGRGSTLTIPALGTSAIGTHIGVEYGILDSSLSLVATSQAAWSRIDR